jgi:methylmalonyl-CoA mutase
MSSPQFADWRAQVQKELGDTPFEKALVAQTPEGLSIQPLYVEAAAARPAVAAVPRRTLCCMRHERPDAAAIADDVDGGADALWVPSADGPWAAPLAAATRAGVRVLVDDAPGAISTLRAHAAGADAADELALALSLGVAHLRAGGDPGGVTFRLAVGRDTFLELAKLRAARLLWQKVLVACGAPDASLAALHAVSAWRTLTQRDPWVNMLRVTTHAFAAMLGGADLFTPAAFDDALAAQGPLGRRVARNTVLVLREESHLGRVADPAGGSYYLDTLTDALARAAWTRFQALEREGGAESPALAARLEAAWKKRAEAVAKRKEPITGVSEFANLGETLPARPAPARPGAHRDAEAVEALRDRADALGAAPRVTLSLLGPPAEHRARAGFARGFFAAGGFAVEERAEAPGSAAIACLCGADERYASEAADRARALKAAGVRRVLLAGRPGALEADLRAAGVDGFVFVGADVVATLSALYEVAP